LREIHLSLPLCVLQTVMEKKRTGLYAKLE
jgi:hypothetical protein